MSTKQELQELNKKFDVLISLMTQQQLSFSPPVEMQESTVNSAPIKKKRGRPKKTALVSQQAAPLIEPIPVVEKKVRLHVNPLINIAGEEYYGNVEVTEGIASQLRNMMQKWQAYEQRTQQFIDHGVRDHGVM